MSGMGPARLAARALRPPALPARAVREPAGSRRARAVALAGLVAASLLLRTDELGRPLWMDEGIAVGIAAHPLREIPGVLRLDGSPPLYYLLLHLWMDAVGRSELAVRALSLLCALLAVPAALWAGAAAAGRRTGWILAVLVACVPFVTRYAQETRMYALVVLLGFACLGCFIHAYVRREAAYRVPFGLALAALLYTHGWAALLAAGLAAAFAFVLRAAPSAERRRLLSDGALGFAVAGALALPWMSTLAFQAGHTAAPWATSPSPAALLDAPAQLFGGRPAALLVLVLIGVALVPRPRADRTARVLVPALAAAAAVPVLAGWLLSQVIPAWDSRYLAVVLAPALLLAALGLARIRGPALAGLVVLVALWAPAGASGASSDAALLARQAAPHLRPGDLVVSTALAQVPLLAYYLPPRLRYATTLGPIPDPGVVDWRDVVERLGQGSARAELAPLLRRLPRGARVLLVTPRRWDARSRVTALGRRQRARAAQVRQDLLRDPRFALRARLPGGRGVRPAPGDLRGLLYASAATE